MMQVLVKNCLFIESESDSEPEPENEVATEYGPIIWADNELKGLKRHLTKARFKYGGSGQLTTLRKLLNFDHFFDGEDALIK